jgi:hypothetical protein
VKMNWGMRVGSLLVGSASSDGPSILTRRTSGS